MAQSIVVSGTLTAGEAITISKTHTSEHTHTRKFELAAGAVMQLAFQSAIEGTALRLMHAFEEIGSRREPRSQILACLLDQVDRGAVYDHNDRVRKDRKNLVILRPQAKVGQLFRKEVELIGVETQVP